jgi:DNA-binding MarR family transcriptional regulator
VESGGGQGSAGAWCAVAWVEIMQVVGATADCRVLDIASALSINVGGASKVVDRVEAAGLCRRQPNPIDGRSNVIRLTEPGAQLLQRSADDRAGGLHPVTGNLHRGRRGGERRDRSVSEELHDRVPGPHRSRADRPAAVVVGARPSLAVLR